MNLRRISLVILGLLLFGGARLRFEHQLTADYHAAHLLEGMPGMDVREQAGQMGFIAALSGFRSVVGDFLWLQAYDAWSETNWGRLKFLLDSATSLQPRNTEFWDMASWHMAWNASLDVLRDERRQPRETLRIKASRQYIQLGEAFLLRGIEYNPDSARLWERLGDLYRDKMDDHCRAAVALTRASHLPHAYGYVERAGLYELSKCPGHEAEALQKMLEVYHRGPRERLPTLLTLIDKLQKDLNVPEAQRIDIKKDLEEATPRGGRRLPK